MSEAYQLFGALLDDEYQRLKESIAEHGILVPVEVDENGTILDGHHRVRAWQELREAGVKVPDYPRIVRKFATDAEKRNHVRALNLLRRHLTVEQRVQVWAEMRADGMTLQAIADVSGVGRMTVSRALEKSVFPNGKTDVVGKDGKSYPARKQRRVSLFANTGATEKRAVQVAQKLDDAPDKVLDLRRAERIARERLVAGRKEAISETALPSSVDLRLGDFREVLADIPDNSIDLIFTDPPYPREFLPLWGDLARFAARVLKPGRLLIAYSGKLDLPSVMVRLGEELNYVWVCDLILPGAHSRIHPVQMTQITKPILFYSKGKYQPLSWMQDAFFSEGKDKELHDWQQSLGAAQYYIEHATQSGETVVDPFLGAGTTGLAAGQLGRNFIGAEIDANSYSVARKRISELAKATTARLT